MALTPGWPVESLSPEQRIEQYAAEYTRAAHDDFERTLVHFRQKSVLAYLDRRRPKFIVEVGCGLEYLSLNVHRAGQAFDRWVIVEPSADFVRAARQQLEDIRNVDVVQAFFEDTAEELRSIEGSVDAVILSGLLHEVSDPGSLLERACALLSLDGRAFIVVPNAASLHRRLAVAMGLIDTVTAPSDRNRDLLQRRIFDLRSLTELCAANGLEVVDSGGLFLKPFTNAQMKLCEGHLPASIMEGLWRVGCDLPDLASEIFVEVRKLSSTPAASAASELGP